MTTHVISQELSKQCRYLQLGVVIHPPHSSRSHGGFLWAVHCLQWLYNQIYRLELALLPVSDIEEEGNSSYICLVGVDKAYTCRKKKTQVLKQMELTADFSPVPVCCSPAVAKETSFRLGTIFVLVVVLSSQKATCRTVVISEFKLKSVVRMLMNSIWIIFSLHLEKKILLRQDQVIQPW